MKRRSGYNPKRRIASPTALTQEERAKLAQQCSYGGNPAHKRNPADYGLIPPASPRPGKTLCDASGPIPKATAEELLRAGILKGMFSQPKVTSGWPQNVWAVEGTGEVFEAQLENRNQGAYHGYPIPIDDDFRAIVLDEWNRRQE